MMRHLTHLGGARVTVGASVALALAGDGRLAAATALANALSHLVVHLLKRLVARPRPCDAGGAPLALVEPPDPFSFPSGHAAAATALATTVAWAHPPAAAVLGPLAAVVCASRVRLRVHHVSDVVAGALLGLGGAWAAATLVL
jgi:undecaprenyl-diphosphatase